MTETSSHNASALTQEELAALGGLIRRAHEGLPGVSDKDRDAALTAWEKLLSDSKPIAWRVEFEDSTVELWPAEDIQGAPAFGRWVTPLVAAGPTVDNNPDDDTE